MPRVSLVPVEVNDTEGETMKTLVHLRPRTDRRIRPAILALAAATALAGGAIATAGAAKLDPPTLEQGLLTVDAGSGNDTIVARLKAGDPNTLEIDLTGDGVADFSFARADVSELVLDGGSGDDVIRIDESGGIFTAAIPTTFEGGSGNDTMLGGSGAETYRGGSGNDFADGNRGNDVADAMGSGNDTFQWDPGDGNDTIEGDSGTDTMLFNGANVAERIEMSANGDRLRFTRDVANIVMDTDSVERVVFNALGGADLVTVNDLSATDVKQVDVDLAATGGAGDGAVDQVVVNGTGGNDTVRVTGAAGAVRVAGLAATVDVLHAEPTDQLSVNGLAGNDVLDASGLAAGAISLTLVP
jgi:Ca2+-binding RTX toxin-like protein